MVGKVAKSPSFLIQFAVGVDYASAEPKLGFGALYAVLARAAALQLVAVRRSTGNDVNGPLFRHERPALQSVAVQAVDWQRR